MQKNKNKNKNKIGLECLFYFNSSNAYKKLYEENRKKVAQSLQNNITKNRSSCISIDPQETSHENQKPFAFHDNSVLKVYISIFQKS